MTNSKPDNFTNRKTNIHITLATRNQHLKFSIFFHTIVISKFLPHTKISVDFDMAISV